MRPLIPTATLTAVLAASLFVCAQTPVPQTPAAAGTSVEAVVAHILDRERVFGQEVVKYQPRVETYVQQLRPDVDLGEVPSTDHYYLGRLDWSHGFADPLFSGAGDTFGGWPLESLFKAHFLPQGFAAMIMPDRIRFDTRHYAFSYQGREFLGQLRCVVFDVSPRPGTGAGLFVGRIWAEDQGYNIVRFDGTFVPNSHSHYVHFDSWRQNMGPDLWLPVSVYSQESDLRTGLDSHTDFKSQTRFWGYNLGANLNSGTMTDMQVENATVDDQSQSAHDLSPLGDQRAWELKAENDVLARMQKAGLLAPPGEVDKVLSTVVTNLEVTNNLVIDPEVRCRVMLTSPLESFTVGHTIVVSRGLIDVLPDEASLAMILAHELGHIALDHGINTDYGFDDRMMFQDEQSFDRLRLARSPAEETAADVKGIELLKNSPYKDKLAQAGLFLEALNRRAPGIPNLVSAHLGNRMVLDGRVKRMQALLADAPQLQQRDLKQIAALPLGARIALDPWTDNLTLLKAQPEAILAARDKLSFEITPYMPYLQREATTANAANPVGPKP